MTQRITSHPWLRIFTVALIAACITLSITPSTAMAATNCTTTVLKSGSKGTCVTQLQNALSVRGIPSGPKGTDGSFGPSTRAAVIEYQKLYGLKADGIAGPKTWATIKANPKPHRKITDRLTKRWSESGTIVIVDKMGKRGKPAVSNVARVYLFVDGKLLGTAQARTGGMAYNPNDGKYHRKNTPTGEFRVTRKIVDEVSRTYGNAPMPYSVYFNGPIAVHGSPGFMKDGYGSAGTLGSNGCVNVNVAFAKLVYKHTKEGRNQVVVQQS